MTHPYAITQSINPFTGFVIEVTYHPEQPIYPAYTASISRSETAETPLRIVDSALSYIEQKEACA